MLLLLELELLPLLELLLRGLEQLLVLLRLLELTSEVLLLLLLLLLLIVVRNARRGLFPERRASGKEGRKPAVNRTREGTDIFGGKQGMREGRHWGGILAILQLLVLLLLAGADATTLLSSLVIFLYSCLPPSPSPSKEFDARLIEKYPRVNVAQ